jgi:hypothetical protein
VPDVERLDPAGRRCVVQGTERLEADDLGDGLPELEHVGVHVQGLGGADVAVEDGDEFQGVPDVEIYEGELHTGGMTPHPISELMMDAAAKTSRDALEGGARGHEDVVLVGMIRIPAERREDALAQLSLLRITQIMEPAVGFEQALHGGPVRALRHDFQRRGGMLVEELLGCDGRGDTQPLLDFTWALPSEETTHTMAPGEGDTTPSGATVAPFP